MRIAKRRLQRIIRDTLDPPSELECGGIKPIFVVGCGHSGTTVVANQLFQNPNVLPIARESHIFHPLIRHSNCARTVFEWLFISQVLDVQAFVEKTPKHIHSIARIIRLLPDSVIVFVHRDPTSTVTSLYKRFGDLDFCIERYNIDNSAGVEAMHKFDNVVDVRLDRFQADPRGIVSTLFARSSVDIVSDGPRKAINFFSRVKSGLLPYRVEQVGASINKSKDQIHGALTTQQLQYVCSRTAVVASKLGYT